MKSKKFLRKSLVTITANGMSESDAFPPEDIGGVM